MTSARARWGAAVAAMGVLALAAPALAIVFPGLVGADRAEPVLSGSMAPTIHAGDIVFLRAFEPTRDAVAVGDVIAFRLAPASGPATLHRVIAETATEDGVYYTTRGDANPEADPHPVPRGAIEGTYHGRLPWLGRVVEFGKTKPGILAFVVLPALLVALTETFEIYRRLAARTRKGPGTGRFER